MFVAIHHLMCENVRIQTALEIEARGLGLSIPPYPEKFEDPSEVESWAITVRRRILAFNAGRIDKSGRLIEEG